MLDVTPDKGDAARRLNVTLGAVHRHLTLPDEESCLAGAFTTSAHDLARALFHSPAIAAFFSILFYCEAV